MTQEQADIFTLQPVHDKDVRRMMGSKPLTNYNANLSMYKPCYNTQQDIYRYRQTIIQKQFKATCNAMALTAGYYEFLNLNLNTLLKSNGILYVGERVLK